MQPMRGIVIVGQEERGETIRGKVTVMSFSFWMKIFNGVLCLNAIVLKALGFGK